MNTGLTLGEYLRRLRREKRWQLYDLANASGLSISHLSRIENDAAVPNPETVVKLHTALGGNLEMMLEMADCLPREILQRLIDRAGDSTPALHRSTGGQEDPEFGRALIEEIDPRLRAGLTEYFGFSDQNVDGLFAMLQSMATMDLTERDRTIEFLAAFLASRVRER